MSLFSRLNPYKSKLPEPDKALPGRDQVMVVSDLNTVLKSSMKPPFPEGAQTVCFGMGCFWGAEKVFWSIPGVFTTAVGYGAGFTPNPTYEEVCSGLTGHNELVLVVFDPNQIHFKDLLAVFWESHNPTEGMRQGNDTGTQYRSGIYVTSDAHWQSAVQSQKHYNALLSQQGSVDSTTEIKRDISFYYAEDYHQQYLAKNPSGYCPNHTCSATGLPSYKK